jgi:glutathione S-transferase
VALRVHRIAFSTNVERVALAAGHHGLTVEWVDHDPGDRSAIRALSGQELVPVLELDGEVVVDSMPIVRRLDAIGDGASLWPGGPAARARLEILVEWFNGVWKVAPNAIAGELVRPAPDAALLAAQRARMAGWLDLLDGLLAGGPFLLGEAVSAADVCVFPFLKQAELGVTPDDDEVFHHVLAEQGPLGPSHARLAVWVRLMDTLPRA